MKLEQNQIWKAGDAYLRIVRLERLEVEYKSLADLKSADGLHHHVSKKEFCRLIKNAALLTREQALAICGQADS
ncbi:MAG: hypothetical protein D4R65_11770 [Verrucomicrobiaceae bacterium]|nr:MAG: hypothetical protein D4R65_11770 [Verrucomicrobiaceae bacterium]